jgi:ABC-type uncharacterized transport system permease subunit
MKNANENAEDAKIGILKHLHNTNQRLTAILLVLVALGFSAFVIPAFAEAKDYMGPNPPRSVKLEPVTKAFLWGAPLLWPVVFTGLLVLVFAADRLAEDPDLKKKLNVGVSIFSAAWVLLFIFSAGGPGGHHGVYF